MNDAERMPWMLMKRLERWSPLAAVKPMLLPVSRGECCELPQRSDGPDVQARR